MTLIARPGTGERRRLRIRLLLLALKGLSHLYRAAVQTRLWLFANGILRHHTLGCQVISIGNLTVGGTGKTPVVEIFARELQKAGRHVAILSRGYKRAEPPLAERLLKGLLFGEARHPPLVVSDGRRVMQDSLTSGDEPFMLASNLPNVVVLVDKNRVKSGRYAINKMGCDTLVLDDGFQYLRLKHRLEIVLVDRTSPFGNEQVLPRGLLREPVRNIRRADVIFLTKSDGVGTEPLKRRLRALNDRAEIVECRHSPQYLKNVFTGERRDLIGLDGLRIVAMSGIASPIGFERELRRLGAIPVMRIRFADHHRYSVREIEDIVAGGLARGAQAVITTEKDAVRIPKIERLALPLFFLRVDIEILSGAEDFRSCIARICFRHDA